MSVLEYVGDNLCFFSKKSYKVAYFGLVLSFESIVESSLFGLRIILGIKFNRKPLLRRMFWIWIVCVSIAKGDSWYVRNIFTK
jgi:hypothetical protein